ncbi:MAG TPA: hypothetical protein VGH09_06185 [Solirubrobacteraceae bacterium]
MTDLLEEQRKQINGRLSELRPVVEEYRRLEAAIAALDGIGPATPRPASATQPSTRAKRGPGRPRGSVNRGSKAPPVTTPVSGARNKLGRKKRRAGRSKASAGRPKGGGTRAAHALSVVQGQPGITIPEMAAKMGIGPNYLYRVLPGLQQEGKLVKKGRGWHPKS